MIRLYLDTDELQVAPGTVVAVTLQADSFENPESIESSYTNEVTLPATANNRALLDNLGNLGESTKQYTPTQVRVQGANGVPLMQDADLVIQEVTDNSIRANFFDGASGFLEELGDLTLQMLDRVGFGSDVEKTGANVRSNIANSYTDGFTYASADFGSGNQTALVSGELWPFTYFYEILTQIASQTSYTFDETAGLFQDTFFRTCALAYSGDRYNQESYFLASLAGFNITAASTPSYTNIAYNTGSIGEENLIIGNDNFSSGGFTVRDSRKALFFEAKINVEITTDAGAYEYKVRIRNTTLGITYDEYDSGAVVGAGATVNETITIQSDLTKGFADGDLIQLQIDAITGLNFDFTEGYFRNDDGRDDETISGITGNEVNLYAEPPSGFVTYSLALMPDMLCKDFVKEVLKLFCARLDVDKVTKTIVVRKFEDYSTDTAGSDTWDNLADLSKSSEIEYQYGSYAQTNRFTYSNDNEIGEGFGAGEISITNSKLSEAPTDIVSSLFAASATQECIVIPILTGSPLDLTEELAPRIAYMESQASPATTVDTVAVNPYNSAKFTNLSWSVFTGGTTPTDTGLLPTYWDSFRKMIQSMEKLTSSQKLSAVQVAELDFFTPKYVRFTNGLLQVAGYYMLQLVEQYTGTDTVRVELIRLNPEK